MNNQKRKSPFLITTKRSPTKAKIIQSSSYYSKSIENKLNQFSISKVNLLEPTFNTLNKISLLKK